jgi:glycosyltransferase 2 family protein
MKYIKFSLKLLLAMLIIWVIRDKIKFEQLDFILSNPFLFSIVPLCWFLNQILTSLRLSQLMKLIGSKSTFYDIFNANMSSLFVGNVLPGIIGADVIKYLYIKKNDPYVSTRNLIAVITIDRAFGLMAVIFWSFVFSFFLFFTVGINWLKSNNLETVTLIPTILIVLIMATIFLFKFFFNLFLKNSSWLFIRFIFDFYNTIFKLPNKKYLIFSLIYNLSAVLILILGLVLIGGALHGSFNGHSMYMFQLFLVPLVLVSLMVPLTPMGIGVTQITMAGAYSLYGLDSSVGITVSSISQLSLLLISLIIGGLFFLKGRDKFPKNNSIGKL